MTVNDRLLEQIRSRTGSRSEFGYGITTADSYVKQYAEHCGNATKLAGLCGGMTALAKAVGEASNKLVYANPDMVVEAKASVGDFSDVLPKGEEIELPKNTLMLLRHVLTTPLEDRDNDILRTQGATVDPKMPLLWQHIPSLPIGKRLLTVEHTKDTLRLVTALIDINELTADIAKMIEADILRFSHGFRALEFEERKVESGAMPGFEITKFEIMEASLVSVPSNVDAEMEVFTSGKWKSDLMKEFVKELVSQRAVVVAGADINAKPAIYGGCDDLLILADDRPITQWNDRSGKGRHFKQTTADKQPTKYYGDLEGSWEWVETRLRNGAKSHLESNGIAVDKGDWTWLVATFADRGIICIAKEETETCYQSGWRFEGDVPAWSGELKEVEITAVIREKIAAIRSQMTGDKDSQPNLADSSLLQATLLMNEVAIGSDAENEAHCRSAIAAVNSVRDAFRVDKALSKRNQTKLQDAVDDLKELVKVEDVPRAAKSLANGARQNVSSVITSAGSGEDEGKDTTVGDVLAYLAQATPETLRGVQVAVKANLDQHDMHEAADQYESMLDTPVAE